MSLNRPVMGRAACRRSDGKHVPFFNAFAIHPTPTGVDGELVTRLNTSNLQPLHPLLGWAEKSPAGRASCQRKPTHAERTTTHGTDF